MKNVLIVGGAGYIGSHTVKEFHKLGYQCVVMDNLVYGHRDAIGDAIFIEADLLDRSKLQEIFSSFSFDMVIHFAAYTYVGESVENPRKYYQNNVIGTFNLLDAMLENNVKNIVFSSTCAVYGNPDYTPIDEQHSKNPISPYGKSKWMVEEILSDYHQAYGLNYIALRYFNAAGCDLEGILGERHDPETHLIPLILQVALGKRKDIAVFGADYDTPDGTCIRDYIHVEDLAIAHRLAAEKLWKTSESMAINLGTGIGTSVQEVIKSVKHITQIDIPIRYVERRVGDPAVLLADNLLAQEKLGWEPMYKDIDNIVKSAWVWMEKNKNKI